MTPLTASILWLAFLWAVPTLALVVELCYLWWVGALD